jgi:hypothetical protein
VVILAYSSPPVNIATHQEDVMPIRIIRHDKKSGFINIVVYSMITMVFKNDSLAGYTDKNLVIRIFCGSA